jgi:nucleoside-diphosphate-sugar epimerase
MPLKPIAKRSSTAAGLNRTPLYFTIEFCAGIRALFWDADRFFSRRLPYWTSPRRRETARARPSRVFGYKGKQVRDNIHSFDLVEAFAEFVCGPRAAEVYNIGGNRHSNCSILEAIEMCEQISGRKLRWSYEETNRIGDHIWWISDVRKVQRRYPAWKFRYGLRGILEEIHRAVVDRVERQ